MTVNYDCVIWGCSLRGISIAIQQRKKGRSYSVLIMNRYGFPGCSITESLDLVRRLSTSETAENEIQKIESSILQKIGQEKNGFLGRDGEEVILNPETVKHILYRELENYNIELLFHLRPVRIVSHNDEAPITIILAGREGQISVSSYTVYDCSDDYSLVALLPGRNRILIPPAYNFIISCKRSLSSDLLSEICQYRKLQDGRFWISLKICCDDVMEIERHAQQKLALFSQKLPHGDRVQILPAQTQIVYRLKDRPLKEESLMFKFFFKYYRK